MDELRENEKELTLLVSRANKPNYRCRMKSERATEPASISP